MPDKILFRTATVSRVAEPDDESFRGKRGWGQEMTLSFEIKIHANPQSNAIVINYPGYQGDIDGYNNKYQALAHLVSEKGVGAAVQMGNHRTMGFLYERSILADLKATIEFVLKDANLICSTKKPVIYLMGFSAGAGAVAAVAADYPEVEKILLVAPSGDAGEVATRKGLANFRGEVYITIGEQDEVVGVEAGKLFLEMATGAKKKALVVIPDCDHQFRGKRNGMIMSKAPLWAFAGDDSFPSPKGGTILYE